MSAKPAEISLPQGGGAMRGIGESFQPDLHTGTGNLTVPVELPPGRGGFAPSISLAYSSGNPNGAFGAGWALSVPGVRRKTSHGLPRYDAGDTFVLSGAEDLVPVPGAAACAQRYRPRVEGLFARIDQSPAAGRTIARCEAAPGRYRATVPKSADAPPGWRDPAAVSDPADPQRVFAWLLSETVDPSGNLIRYRYQRYLDLPG